MSKIKLRGRQKMKAVYKMAFVVAGGSLLGLASYFTIFINSTQVSLSNAALHQNMMMGYDMNSGEVITYFSWDEGFITKPDVGPEAMSVSKSALCTVGGTENSKGLSPGKNMSPLNFTIPAVKEMNLGGIDVSIDYRKSENNCNLFTRGGMFNMGLKDGKLAIHYKLSDTNNKITKISEVTRYEIPDDDEFRNYRFLHDPVTGRSEMFVNGVVIWSNAAEPESNLVWKDKDDIVIGKDLKGDGTDKVFIDNVLIKATRQISELPVTLLNFEAAAEKDYVMISWYTSSETAIDSFYIEKSFDAQKFITVGKVKATGAQGKLTAYAVVDKTPNPGLAYYRLSPSNKPLKSMTISMIGYKYRGTDGDMKLSDVNIPEESSK